MSGQNRPNRILPRPHSADQNSKIRSDRPQTKNWVSNSDTFHNTSTPFCGLGWSLYHYHVVWWMPGWWFLVTMGLIYLICHSLLCSPVLLATNSQKLKIKLLRISFYFNVAISSLLFHFLSLSQSELGLSFLSLDLVKSPNVAFFCVCPYELDSAFFLSIVVI